MNFKERIKLALSILKDGVKPAKSVVHKSDLEPSLVIDNQLLSGKNVLITGAGKNIGKSIAIEMAKQGANIFFTDLNPQSCTELEQELASYQVESQGFVSDISKIEDINRLLNILHEQEIYIDILVNNVGIQLETKQIINLDLKEWYQTFNTNIFGPIYLTKNIAKMMMQNSRHGSIIFVTSIHQWITIGFPSYSSSKAALGMIIQELAVDLAPAGIRVNGIAPGLVAEDEEGKAKYHHYAPLHHTSINPCYIGRAAVYLASEYFSKFTTGSVIKIDAGVSSYSYCLVPISPE
ncbi:SDR family NAD(P)-dependent oxidoreductase [Merismopedia glauca]|uniref:SDR family oxidoreductase n=1 Tax=Merismopedia glauca CCAP 1448/3 TaxID=1296344 RepID=A0A2T1C3Q8_9CYAN|nr:SDR family oxidoreductase [Merismopedia glauca]PSB02889.1 hypothetical protein C7B64_11005 [Merismopedia glauca CCAP 1448/3]